MSFIMRGLRIRLGGSCNQCCSFCHSNSSDNYEYNKPRIHELVKYGRYEQIRYTGGEPLLFFDTMVDIIESNPRIIHTLVSNGSLLDKSMVDYFNNRNVHFGLSINEFTQLSDEQWVMYGKLSNRGLARIYTGDYTFNEIDEITDRYARLAMVPMNAGYNLMHTTDINSKGYSPSQIQYYIDKINSRLELAVDSYCKGKVSYYYQVLAQYLKLLYYRRMYGCHNIEYATISLDGRWMRCTYDCSYQSSDPPLVLLSDRPSKCRSCQLAYRCPVCYISTNQSHECFIYNSIYDQLTEIIEYYRLSDKLGELVNSVSRQLEVTDNRRLLD